MTLFLLLSFCCLELVTQVNLLSLVGELVSNRGYPWWRVNGGQEEDQ